MKLVTTIAIYVAPIWDRAMDKRTYRTGIDAAYRRSALSVLSSFQAVSTDAAVVMTWMIPLKLVVDIKKKKHDTSTGMKLSNPVQIVDDA